jgi:ankyrin repeat protein
VLHSVGAEVNASAIDGSTPVYLTAQNDPLVIHALHSLGSDVNKPNKNGATPVLIAAQNGHEAVVRMLHSLGAEMNTPKNWGQGRSTWRGRKVSGGAVVRVLAIFGADMNCLSENGMMPLMSLMTAVMGGDEWVVSALLRAGAELKAALGDGQTALTLALSEFKSSMVMVTVVWKA